MKNIIVNDDVVVAFLYNYLNFTHKIEGMNLNLNVFIIKFAKNLTLKKIIGEIHSKMSISIKINLTYKNYYFIILNFF